ncbi:MAG: hypothetical protein UY31_C0048G0003 [Candidatus Wolfebacteria bacterium GW2011_GWE1_48_7]|uniref:Uncharacterized protein n=2 Tax=Candidatus Wolfeibacteriota TaxID=1752735 RepID=A0A0G1X417_9BACT|nr:MAG: hypothetical protein UX70_C0001G0186 [Candidatus Wolfebacteria bacterium GW2011_GWB1_47_1]KKU36710.1 MAG: hypothetical protein UX49_C0010G0006 [Candidatus Wolfebacteria bacterium GW2011_GWC2_46_275]KKU41992.1 MAG: hypothetical protein UX58_C0004G0051 [Candidatus Wolfebacteria bacterium GW2011_GWB2_46_69]KKU54472.1 MAG: hypothetical protein UX76_C0002G0065 [Candidatus Wolfebacteria bacterium GW2011_GWC1_47_103]KKU59799.1 MAG: hypothetical protein UX83_C0002G0086 [Candidatus Wolfebacteria
MPGCPDSCKGVGHYRGQKSPMVTAKGSVFQQDTMAEERVAMEELKLLDKRIDRFYGETIRAHTMAAAGVILGADLATKIDSIKQSGGVISAQLRAFAEHIDRSIQTTEEHLVGHLPEKEEGDEES